MSKPTPKFLGDGFEQHMVFKPKKFKSRLTAIYMLTVGECFHAAVFAKEVNPPAYMVLRFLPSGTHIETLQRDGSTGMMPVGLEVFTVSGEDFDNG